MANITSTLEGLGLSKQESAVYLAALELGSSSISDIAKKASIKRPTAYYIVESLLQKGLISRAPKGKRTLYTAERPQVLLRNVRLQEEKLAQILPELEALQKTARNRPKIRFFEGKDGINAIYEEMFRTHHTMLAIGSLKDLFKIYSHAEFQYWFKLLREHGGKIKDLLDYTPEAKAYSHADFRKGLGPVKYLPKDFELGTDMLIVGDKISLVSFSAMVGMIIENPEVAKTQRQTFEFMWKHL